MEKLRIVMLDMFFIILNSADLALAFYVLYDSEAGCLVDRVIVNVSLQG
jgi:hypothetical protein